MYRILSSAYMDRRNLIIKINYVSGSKFNFKYVPLDVLQAAAISAVGGVAVEGVAVEGGSLAVGGVAVEDGSSAVGGVAVEDGSSAVGGVAVEGGSSAVGGVVVGGVAEHGIFVVSVNVSLQLAFPPPGVSWQSPG